MSDGRVVKATLPFEEIPRGEAAVAFLHAHAKRDQVDLRRIEFFRSIDNSYIADEMQTRPAH